MIGVEPVPEWLQAGDMLQGFGGEPRRQRKEYRL